jgi:molybdenum cofactor synthesis domain-containing protein
MNVEILCVGNELLIGKIVNTNATWLAQRVTSLGCEVSTITVVGDNLPDIERGLMKALETKPDLLITTGGLGPTYDDKTLEGISEALDQQFKVNEKALEMVREKYEQYHQEGRISQVLLTPARKKMATFPEKAIPLPNPVGTAPGVKLVEDDSIVICLPGVPSEMKAIFDKSIAPMIRDKTEGKHFYEKTFRVEGIGESAMAPHIEKATKENPHVYVKSHPKGEERIPHIEIHLSTTTKSQDIAEKRLSDTENRLRELLKKISRAAI